MDRSLHGKVSHGKISSRKVLFIERSLHGKAPPGKGLFMESFLQGKVFSWKGLYMERLLQGKVSTWKDLFMERSLHGKVSTWKGTLLPSFFMLTARHFLNLKLGACVKYKPRKYSFVKIVIFVKEFTVENNNLQTDSVLR